MELWDLFKSGCSSAALLYQFIIITNEQLKYNPKYGSSAYTHITVFKTGYNKSHFCTTEKQIKNAAKVFSFDLNWSYSQSFIKWCQNFLCQNNFVPYYHQVCQMTHTSVNIIRIFSIYLYLCFILELWSRLGIKNLFKNFYIFIYCEQTCSNFFKELYSPWLIGTQLPAAGRLSLSALHIWVLIYFHPSLLPKLPFCPFATDL